MPVIPRAPPEGHQVSGVQFILHPVEEKSCFST